MKIASFNVENMFRRAIVLNKDEWEEGKDLLEAYTELTTVLQKETYSEADKKRILDLLALVELEGSDENKYIVLRRPRGQLVSRHKDGTIEVVAKGRGDWIGWLELKREAVNEQATRNTAAVIADLNADILGVIEAEDRPALTRFNENVLNLGFPSNNGPWSYGHVMLIDGNDDRGIDVGLFTKKDFDITGLHSHVDDPADDGKPVFSRDCPEFEIVAPGGERLLVMVNHFKSKGYGPPKVSAERRKDQATAVAKIYKQRISEGLENIVILGDLNDTPKSDSLAPLLQGNKLKDVSECAGFDWGEREGTYQGTNEKIDYVLLSPALQDKVKAGGINRKGVWHGSQTDNPWELLPTLKDKNEAASDHAAVWVELEL